jgi:hypothetical protein
LPWRRLAWITTLIFLGAVTHVVWDGFTHENDWLLGDFPQLATLTITFAGLQVHYFDLLQFGSSVLGLALLAWWSWKWYRRAPAGCAPADSALLLRARPAIAASIIVFGTGVGILGGLYCTCNLRGVFDLKYSCTAAFITGVDAFALALLVFAVAVHMRVWSASREMRTVMRRASAGRYHLIRDLGGGREKQQ